MSKSDIEKIITWFEAWLTRHRDVQREGWNRISGFMEILKREATDGRKDL